MTYTYSSIDLHHMVSRLQVLVGAKIDQIYQYSPVDFVIRFHKTGIGKREIRILLPYCVYQITQRPASTSQGLPPSFCVYVRKHLGGMYVEQISQIGFNRALSIELTFKDVKKTLVIELFDKGNLIVVNAQGIIENCSLQQTWKNRAVRPNLPYVIEESPNPVVLLDELISQFDSEPELSELTISKVLATRCNIGGNYATLVCQHAQIAPKLQCTKPLLKSVSESLQKVLEMQAMCVVGGKFAPAQFVQGVECDTQTTDPLSTDIDDMSLFLETHIGLPTGAAPILQKKAQSKTEKIIKAQESQLLKAHEDIHKNEEIAKVLQSKLLALETVLQQYNSGIVDSSVVKQNKAQKTIEVDLDLVSD